MTAGLQVRFLASPDPIEHIRPSFRRSTLYRGTFRGNKEPSGQLAEVRFFADLLQVDSELAIACNRDMRMALE